MNRSLLVAAAAALAIASQPADAQQMTTVKVGVTGRPDQAMLEVAKARGYFTEQSLDVQFVPGGLGGHDYTASLATNQIQVAAGSPNAGMFNAVNRGIDLRIVADWAHIGDAKDTTFSFLARADLMDAGEIKTPKDLKGRSLGVGPVYGAYNEMFMVKMLQAAGLTLNDVKAEFLGFPDNLPAMANKKIDGALLIEPLVLAARERGIAKVLMPAGAFDPGAQVAVVFFSAEFSKNKELATRYMVAYLKGVRDLHDAYVENKNRDSITDILVANMSIKDRHIWEASAPHIVDLNGKVNAKHIKEQAEFYKARGHINGPVPDVDKLIDMSFAEAAANRLGVR